MSHLFTTPPVLLSQLSSPCSPEEFGMALAKHFVDTYPKVHIPPLCFISDVCLMAGTSMWTNPEGACAASGNEP